MKYDPHTNQPLLVGDDYGNRHGKWWGGALASDGVIYCFPGRENRILTIDPLNELSVAVKNKIEEYPQKFGFLFQKTFEEEEDEEGDDDDEEEDEDEDEEEDDDEEEDEDESRSPFPTNFDHAVIKFGQEKVLEVLDEHMEPVQVFCKGSNLCSFMIVASSKESTVSAIHHFLRPDLSWVACIRALQADNVQVLTEKKRKHNSI